jgi:hypothetical protein
MPTDLPPFEFEIRTAKTGRFYVAARIGSILWARWVFWESKENAEMSMYELELARVGRTWTGPSGHEWRVISGPK